jgi:mannose-6-phosphate isomerase-like protein (cupin superfamily)
MSRDWKTIKLPGSPDRPSASGSSEIRLLPRDPDARPSFPEGEIVHATALTDQPSDPGRLTDVGEFFYILEGKGELWRATGALEEVAPLYPGRCVSIPPGIEYQYRASRTPMKFLVATAPRFNEKGSWVRVERRHWDDQGNEVSPRPWATKDVVEDSDPDYPAPDGSEIRLLPTFEEGGLAHCRLPAGTYTEPVRHRTVKEVWYVLGGRGQVWRGHDVDDKGEVVDVDSGSCLTIPTGVIFQFRASSAEPLEIMIGTFPKWPGASEAEPVAGAGPWRRTLAGPAGPGEHLYQGWRHPLG